MKSRWLRCLLPLAALMPLLSGCGDPYLSALSPSGPVADNQLWLMKLSLTIMIGVFFVVFAIYVYVLIRYRKRPGQKGLPPQVEGSTKLEIIWTVIPIILLAVIAVPTVSSTFMLAEDHSGADGAVEVKVIGHQFWWEFQYPKLGITTAQELYIPTGRKVQLTLTSADVIHSFWVPSLGGKTDANPGGTNTMWLQADKPGTYEGKCAELCGASHALMDFKVVAVPSDEFEGWVAKIGKQTAKPAATPIQPTTPLAQEGQQVFAQSCIGCHAVDGQGGKVAPDLTGFADRKYVAGILPNTRENLAAWLNDPQQVKPGSRMPNLHLSPEQVNSLVEYLSELKLK